MAGGVLEERRGPLATALEESRDSVGAAASGDQRTAQEKLQGFIALWPRIEGEVMARSARAYGQIEEEMTRASALLLSGPGARAGGEEVLRAMVGQLELARQQSGYTAWDAGLILLREGMEALLVLAALLAMLRKTGTRGGARWVWTGAGTGLLASAALAVILGFAATSAGAARETTEGYVGLASVALMLTVGAWLHRRSNLQSWNTFIKNRVGGAVAAGSMWSLFFLALLAVLREGAESVVFFIGIAPGVSLPALLTGIGGALLLLVVLGYLVIRFSVRLPLHAFFLAATILIYYLAFKIAGESLHALQAGGALASHFTDTLPSIDLLGMSPSWETFAIQMAILALVIGEIVVTEARRFRNARHGSDRGAARGA